MKPAAADSKVPQPRLACDGQSVQPERSAFEDAGDSAIWLMPLGLSAFLAVVAVIISDVERHPRALRRIDHPRAGRGQSDL